MQAQVVHQSKATIPWIPALIAALLVFATVAGLEIALRGRGSAAVPASVSSVDDGALQKAQMAEAGITNVSGVQGARDVGRPAWDHEGMGVDVTDTGPAVVGGLGGPHPRTKFGGSGSGSSDGPEPAPRATISRIEQVR